MTHPATVESYPGTLKELAEDIGDLRYDELANFFSHLARKMKNDSRKDRERGRENLAMQLFLASLEIADANYQMKQVWEICKPHMEDE